MTERRPGEAVTEGGRSGERSAELQRRLGECLDESGVQAIQIRSLETDLRIRAEFVAVVERRLDETEVALEAARRELGGARLRPDDLAAADVGAELETAVRRVAELEAEVARWRSRSVVRTADRLAAIARRHPVPWKAVRALRRALR